MQTATYKEMVQNLLNVSVPVFIAFLSSMFMEVVNTAFIGHLGETAKVAGVGLGNMYVNITC